MVVTVKDIPLSFERLGRLNRMAKKLVYRLAERALAHSSGAVELLRSLGLPYEKVVFTSWVIDNERFAGWAREIPGDAIRNRMDLRGT